MQVAFVCQSKRVDPRDFAFRVEAVNISMVRDFAPAWAKHLPGPNQEPWPCVDYAGLEGVNVTQLHPIFEMDSIGDPDALGFHDDEANFVYGRTLVPGHPLDATTESHEALEMRGDPTCDRWITMPSGMDLAQEVGDPVEADAYEVEATIAGETRSVRVSNFVLPAYFVAESAGPWDFMRRLNGPFSMTEGGYQIVRNPRTGEITNVFAAGRDTAAGHAARKMLALKRADPHSRLSRRLLRFLRGA